MAKLTIVGNANPVIGKEEMYSISSMDNWLHQTSNPFQPPLKSPLLAEPKWGIMVQTKNGWVRTERNNKDGKIVSYKFTQKSLLHKGVKIVVEHGEDKGEFIIHPQRAKEPKISKVELLDANYKPITKGKKLSYKDTIIARASCIEMFKMNVAFTLWEDDAKGEGHDPITNAFNKINLIPIIQPVNEKGIAEAIFRLPAYTMAVQIANARIAAGDKNEGATHEYYVTADIVNTKIQKASANVNVINPTYNPEPPKRERTLPKNAPPPKPKTTTPPAKKAEPKTNSPKFPVTSTAKSSKDLDGKILSAEFVDGKGQRLHSSKVGKTVIMKITAKDMKNKKVKVIVWEEDNFRWTNDEIYSKDWILSGDENYIGIQLTKKMFEKANDGGGDGTKQDYFIEVIYNKTSVDSPVMSVTLDAEPTKIPKGDSVAVIKGQKPEKKKEEKPKDTCGIEYRNQVSCTRYGKQYGPVFWGALKLANYTEWNILLSNNKITQEEKSIIIGMSANEGNLDSVQSYDSEIVTVGAMQKTINPEGYGEFPIQMYEFKKEYPERFKKLFENCGWEVKEEKTTVNKKEIIKYKAYYLNVTGKDLKNKIRDGFSIDNFKKNVQCISIEPLINAARDPYFQAKQIEDFITRLRYKVLPIKPLGYEHQLKDFLKSKLGKATVLDQHINRPAYVKEDFAKALDDFFKQNSKLSKNPNEWGSEHKKNEEDILEIYGKNRRGTQMSVRYTQMKNNPYLK